MSYVAPTKELRFVLTELADIGSVARHPGFEEATPDMVEAILEEAGRFAAEILEPLNRTGDQQGTRLENDRVVSPAGFAEAYQQFVEMGWQGLNQSTEFDGQGLPFLIQCAAAEIWNSANLSFALCPMLTAGAIEAISAHGSNALKQTYLPKLVSGEWTGTMNLTEPQAGSDLSAVRAKAEPEGDHYRISGQKIFITWGDHELSENILHLTLARLPDAPEGVRGISLFLVPKFLVNDDGSLGARNDARAVSLEHKLGIHASPTCLMSFGDDGGAVGYLVGEENRGLACMFTMMNHARLEVGVEGVGLSERAYQHAVDYARERIQGYAPGHDGRVAIIHHADVRRMLLQMRALTEAGRAIACVTSAIHDHAHHAADDTIRQSHQQRLDLLTPVIKAWCTETSQEVTSLGVQVHGGMGYIEETGAAQYLRDARITTIYEGTTGIQASDLIGRKILRDRGAAMGTLLAELKQFETELLSMEGSQFETMKRRFPEALQALVETVDWVLANAEQTDMAGSVAVNFLMLTGTTLGGWLLAKGAIAAQQQIDNGSTDEFFKTKITVTGFYAAQILPRSAAYGAAVRSGAKEIMAMPAEAF